MPRLPRLPQPALRLFGRIDRFTVECPRCGKIIIATFNRHYSAIEAHALQRDRPTRPPRPLRPRKSAQAIRAKQAVQQKPTTTMVYNPLTSRLCCPHCHRIFAVGLLLYSVGQSAPQAPADQRPTWKQLLELRQTTGAFYLDGPLVRGAEPLNILVESACTCAVGHVSSGCPVHGWDTPADEPEEEVSPLDGVEDLLFAHRHDAKPPRGGE